MPTWQKVIIISIASFILLSANIGGYSLYIRDEVKNAQCAREMAANNDWIVPTFNQQLRTQKPPLHYYFMQAGYKIWGNYAFSARFFSVIFGIGTIVLSWFFARKYLSETTANFTVFILLSSWGFVAQQQLATPDPYLIFFTTGAIMAFYRYHTKQKRAFLYCCYIAMALGTLTKGPVAIVLPGLAIAVFLLVRKKFSFKEVLFLNPPLGLLIILAIAGPWYFLVHVQTNGAWTEGFFLKHNVERFLSPMEGHGGNLFLPLAFVLLMLFPLGLFLPSSIRRVLQDKNPFLIFCLTTSAVIVLFFCVSVTKLPSYIVPAIPFLAIILAHHFSSIEKSKKKHLPIILVVILLISVISLIGWKTQIQNQPELLVIASFYWALIPAIIGTTVALFFSFRRMNRDALISVGLGFMIFHQIFFYAVAPNLLANNPVEKTSHLLQVEDVKIGFRHINPAFVYYFNQEIPVYERIEEIHNLLQITEESIKVLTRPEHLPDLSEFNTIELAREPDLLDGTTTVLLEVIPSK